MSPDCEPDRALQLSRGLFGQPGPDRPDPREPDRKDDPAPGTRDSNR
jgi:hypothetical protein